MPLPFVAALSLVVSIQSAPSATPQLVAREAWTMGTRLGVVVEATSVAEATHAAEDVVREVERFERMLSTWDPRSEMHAVNTAELGRPIEPGRELALLLAEAERYSRISSAAFDSRIGALVDAWDLRGAGVVPTADALRNAREAAGSSSISVDERTGTVIRHASAAWIDTGGFGKGAALRSVARGLESANVGRALIDLGGQLWAQGNADEPWSVHVAHPTERQRPVARLEIQGVSVATSGTSERFIEIDGVRRGHILDPRTGRPSAAWGSVTVVSSDALEADALATALYVMGPDVGLAWAERHEGVDALFLQEDDGELTASWTRGMEQWLIDPPAVSASEPRTHEHQTYTHQTHAHQSGNHR